jgi:oligopeptide transport system permease protein
MKLNKPPTFFKKLKPVKWHLWVLITISLFCFIGPLFYTQDYHTQNLLLGAQPPSLNHLWGTDILGRDLLARWMYGGQISILIGISAGFIAIGLGLAIGSISGFMGGNVDRFFMRLIDILYPLPFTLIIILIMALSGRHIWVLVVVIGCVKWLTMARIIRNRVLILKTSTFVECSYSMGQKPLKIWWKHIMPHLVSLIWVYGTLLIPNIILEEAFISFLGLGVQPPLSSWGLLIFDGARFMEEYPWLLLFPAFFFSLTLYTLNALGDRLRDNLEQE